MQELTFRDFAGAIMGDDMPRAAEVLGALLGLDADASRSAALHFKSRMASDPDFMMKAMGLRTAVTSGTDDDIAKLLGDCFGLGDTGPAVAALRRRYPAAQP
jgi:hypothetical protein